MFAVRSMRTRSVSDRRPRKPSTELVRSPRRTKQRFLRNLAFIRLLCKRVKATEDFPMPAGPERVKDTACQSNTSLMIPPRGKRSWGEMEVLGAWQEDFRRRLPPRRCSRPGCYSVNRLPRRWSERRPLPHRIPCRGLRTLE